MIDFQKYIGGSSKDNLRYCASKNSIPKHAYRSGIISNFAKIVTEYGEGKIGYYYYIHPKYNLEESRKFESDILFYIATNNEDYFYFNFPYNKFKLENLYNDEEFEEIPDINYETEYENEYNEEQQDKINQYNFNRMLYEEYYGEYAYDDSYNKEISDDDFFGDENEYYDEMNEEDLEQYDFEYNTK